jgi:TRAP-type C4-dicarboxylate transport system permease small subunit
MTTRNPGALQPLPRLASLARVAFGVAGTLGVLVFWIATARNHSLGIRVDSLRAFVVYVALPIGAALLCFTATRFKRIRRVQLLVLSIAVVVPTYLMEILLAVFFSSAPPKDR